LRSLSQEPQDTFPCKSELATNMGAQLEFMLHLALKSGFPDEPRTI